MSAALARDDSATKVADTRRSPAACVKASPADRAPTLERKTVAGTSVVSGASGEGEWEPENVLCLGHGGGGLA